MTANEHDPEPSSQALPPGTWIEEFVIERVLGSGGFGITYLAKDTALGRQVVIKENLPVQFAWRETTTGTVLPRHTSGGDGDDFRWSMKNFLREAEMLASLDNPGIVRVLRKFETNGTAYFVMPFVEGLPFDVLIESRQKKGQVFSEDELKGFLSFLLEALGYLHDRGIYHRDIKPANILVTMDGVPVLIDFGSARQRLSERSMTVVESAGYTPFEQLQSRGNVGPWSDLYALGATLCKAITFDAPARAADRIRKDPHERLSKRPDLAGMYSTRLLASVDRALGVDEMSRWQDALEWQDALRWLGELGEATKSERSQFSRMPPMQVPEIKMPKGQKVQQEGPMGRFALGRMGFIGLCALTAAYGLLVWGMAIETRPQSQALSMVASSLLPDVRDTITESFSVIPAGSFQMGDAFSEGAIDERPVHRVNVSTFYMEKHEVTKGKWDLVRSWGVLHGYTDLPVGGGTAADHPVHSIDWHAMLKWCNARSEREGMM